MTDRLLRWDEGKGCGFARQDAVVITIGVPPAFVQGARLFFFDTLDPLDNYRVIDSPAPEIKPMAVDLTADEIAAVHAFFDERAALFVAP
ncbi:MAG: hypothetical protein AB3X44_16060 [Leptothrix sp. (in: b-proteobacteria)]